MRISFFIASFFVSISSYGQEIVTDLNGFRLGRFRDVPKNEFGTPLQKDRFDAGFEYENNHIHHRLAMPCMLAPL